MKIPGLAVVTVVTSLLLLGGCSTEASPDAGEPLLTGGSVRVEFTGREDASTSPAIAILTLNAMPPVDASVWEQIFVLEGTVESSVLELSPSAPIDHLELFVPGFPPVRLTSPSPVDGVLKVPWPQKKADVGESFVLYERLDNSTVVKSLAGDSSGGSARLKLQSGWYGFNGSELELKQAVHWRGSSTSIIGPWDPGSKLETAGTDYVTVPVASGWTFPHEVVMFRKNGPFLEFRSLAALNGVSEGTGVELVWLVRNYELDNPDVSTLADAIAVEEEPNKQVVRDLR